MSDSLKTVQLPDFQTGGLIELKVIENTTKVGS